MDLRCLQSSLVLGVLVAALVELAAACTQSASYGAVPSEAKATELQASLTWHEVKPIGDVYMSTATSIGRGAPVKGGHCGSGYFGAQFHRQGPRNMLLFSMAAVQKGQAFPVGPYCRRDCFDCGHTPKETWKDVQCKRVDVELKIGVRYDFTMHMTMQNASGAMWGVDVVNSKSGETFEVGRMFFVDVPISLPASKCRTLGMGTYSFQEYYAAFKDFHTEATWSGLAFSGVMTPMQGEGYCKGHPLETIKEGISLAGCKQRCAKNSKCEFASYSSRDNAYVRDGKHCMLFETCSKFHDYKKAIWSTARKEAARSKPEPKGYCDGRTLLHIKDKVSSAQCNERCMKNAQCKYASYASEDRAYTNDGKHCMLYSECKKFAGYHANLWTSYKKAAGGMKPMTAVVLGDALYPAIKQDTCCSHFSWGSDKAVVTSRNPWAVRFSSGPDVTCTSGKYSLPEGVLLAWAPQQPGVWLWVVGPGAAALALILPALAVQRVRRGLAQRQETSSFGLLATEPEPK